MKTRKKILSVVLAAIMLLSMAATVFAAPATPIGITGDDTEQTVSKVWTAASNTQLNDTEAFNFTLAYTGATSINSSIATATPQLSGSNMTSKTAAITDTWQTGALGGNTYTGSISVVSLFSGITFSAPGVYSFTLTETAGTNPNITYSTASYTIDVTVVYDTDTYGSPVDALKIAGIVSKTSGAKAEIVFNNTPVANSSLIVSKAVTGNSANVDEYFVFNVNLTAGASGSYAVTGGSHTSNPTAIIAGTQATIYLKHGESFTILNLPVGATYTVAETVNSNYTTSVVVNGGGSSQSNTASSTIGTSSNTVEFTNNRTTPPPTGIFMGILPFMLLIGIALAGVIVFFVMRRRRRSEEF